MLNYSPIFRDICHQAYTIINGGRSIICPDLWKGKRTTAGLLQVVSAARGYGSYQTIDDSHCDSAIRSSLLNWSIHTPRVFWPPQSMRIARNHADLGAFLFDFSLSGCVFLQSIGYCFMLISSGLQQGAVSFPTLHFSERDGHPLISQVLKLF